LNAIQAESSKVSTSDVHHLDVAMKLQDWKDVVGGKSRDQVYDITNLASNFCQGVSSLTQPSLFVSSTSYCDHCAEKKNKFVMKLIKHDKQLSWRIKMLNWQKKRLRSWRTPWRWCINVNTQFHQGKQN